MPNDYFQFKQFTIRQDRCAMKVGTDGVLLGAWAWKNRLSTINSGKECDDNIQSAEIDHHKIREILDIGAGTGLISLMMAQRFPTAHITSVEIDREAAKQCQENFEASPWTFRLKVLPYSLKDAEPFLSELQTAAPDERPLGQRQTYCANECFDFIVSNPPFYNATLKPEDEGRAVARHKDSLPIDEIAAFAQRWLTTDGQLSLVYPSAYDSEVMQACIVHDLQPFRICDVYTKVGKPCKRRMATFGRCGCHRPDAAPTLIREQLAIRNEDGDYSEEYRHLVEPFYLRLS